MNSMFWYKGFSFGMPLFVIGFLTVRCDSNDVTHVLTITGPRWGPTVNTIAILKEEYDFIQPEGGCGEQVSTSPSPPAFDIFLADSLGFLMTQLTIGRPALEDLRWSGDGSYLAFVGSSEHGVRVVDLDANLILFDSLRIVGSSQSSISWSPFEAQFVTGASLWNSWTSTLYVVDVGTRTARSLYSSSSGVFSVSWSAGNRIAFSEGYNYVSLIDPDGMNYQILDSVDVYTDGSLEWSPEGNRLLTTKRRTGLTYSLVEYDLISDQNQDLTPPFSSPPYSVSYSPNGEMIAFIVLHDLYVMNSDGTELRVVANGANGSNWSPDGSRICYISANNLLIFYV